MNHNMQNTFKFMSGAMSRSYLDTGILVKFKFMSIRSLHWFTCKFIPKRNINGLHQLAYLPIIISPKIVMTFL